MGHPTGYRDAARRHAVVGRDRAPLRGRSGRRMFRRRGNGGGHGNGNGDGGGNGNGNGNGNGHGDGNGNADG
jgi:hypothetical protein